MYGLVWDSTKLAWQYLDPYANYTAFQNWAPPIPNTPQSGECTVARYEKAVSGDYGWGWDDVDCSEPHVFICRQMGTLGGLDWLCCMAAVQSRDCTTYVVGWEAGLCWLQASRQQPTSPPGCYAAMPVAAAVVPLPQGSDCAMV
jgi:hypothetical protein